MKTGLEWSRENGLFAGNLIMQDPRQRDPRQIVEVMRFHLGYSGFDIGSFGLGMHAKAVEDFAAGRPLKNWKKDTLSPQTTANYLKFKKDFFDHEPPSEVIWPRIRSPRTDQFQIVHGQYNHMRLALHWEQIRFMLAGEEGITQPNKGEPITQDEMGLFLRQAIQRGLLSPQVESADLERYHQTHYKTFIALHMAIFKYDQVNLENALGKVTLSKRYKDRVLQVAIYKLASMLALTDQIVFEAASLGYPIPADFKPYHADEKYRKLWEEMMGYPLPTVSELYNRAHIILVKNANADKIPALKPFIELTELAFSSETSSI